MSTYGEDPCWDWPICWDCWGELLGLLSGSNVPVIPGSSVSAGVDSASRLTLPRTTILSIEGAILDWVIEFIVHCGACSSRDR